ncbi:hypothetical protein ACJX0J_040405, partial [Zea mays]
DLIIGLVDLLIVMIVFLGFMRRIWVGINMKQVDVGILECQCFALVVILYFYGMLRYLIYAAFLVALIRIFINMLDELLLFYVCLYNHFLLYGGLGPWATTYQFIIAQAPPNIFMQELKETLVGKAFRAGVYLGDHLLLMYGFIAQRIYILKISTPNYILSYYFVVP